MLPLTRVQTDVLDIYICCFITKILVISYRYSRHIGSSRIRVFIASKNILQQHINNSIGIKQFEILHGPCYIDITNKKQQFEFVFCKQEIRKADLACKQNICKIRDALRRLLSTVLLFAIPGAGSWPFSPIPNLGIPIAGFRNYKNSLKLYFFEC